MTNAKQIEAIRKNALKGSRPNTNKGKSVLKLNATKKNSQTKLSRYETLIKRPCMPHFVSSYDCRANAVTIGQLALRL